MGNRRRSRRLMGLTPAIPEFYSYDDRGKLMYIESNLQRVLRLRALLDAALAASQISLAVSEGPKDLVASSIVQHPIGHQGSSLTTQSRSSGNGLRIELGGNASWSGRASGPSSSSNKACILTNDSELSSGGPMRRSRGKKRIDSSSARDPKLSEGRATNSRRRRRSLITIIDNDDGQPSEAF